MRQLLLDLNSSLYHLDPALNITGNIGYIGDLVSDGIVVRIDLEVYDGTSFIPLGQDLTYADNNTGSFSIDWDTEDLPEDLLNSRIPVSYIDYSDNPAFTLASENIVLAGHFTDMDYNQVVIIRADSNQKTLALFVPEIDTVYDWTVYEYPDSYSTYYATASEVTDIDGDGFDEIIIITPEGFIIVDWNSGPDSVTYRKFLYNNVSSWGLTEEFGTSWCR